MGYYLRLRHGGDEIDLTTGNYRVGRDFAPPAPLVEPLMSSGLIGNRYEGGELILENYPDRDFNLNVKVTGASSAETHGAIRRLERFLRNSLNRGDQKTYLIFGPSNAVPYTPIWGQNFAYYEIKQANTGDLWGRYGEANTRSKTIFVNIILKISPVALGIEQLLPVAFDRPPFTRYWATGDGVAGGLIVPLATTNLVPNPVFGHSTYSTGWTANYIRKNTDKEFVLFGNASLECYNGSLGNTVTTSVTVPANAHTMTAIVKARSLSAITGTTADIRFTYNGTAADADNIFHLGGNWYMMWYTITGTAGAAACGVSISTTAEDIYYVGYFGITAGSLPQAPCYGDMLMHTWSGTAHNSTSSRVGAALTMDYGTYINETNFTCSVRVRALVSSDEMDAHGAAEYGIMEWGFSNIFNFHYDGGNSQFEWVVDGAGTTASTSGNSWDAGDILHFHLIASPTIATVYRDGVRIMAETSRTPATGVAPEIMYNGGTVRTGYFEIIGVQLYEQPLTSTEILADYNSRKEYNAVVNAIPWSFFQSSSNYSGRVDNVYDSNQENWFVAGGIPGTLPAKTRYDMTASASNKDLQLMQSVVPAGYAFDPAERLYDDFNTSADTTCSGGGYGSVVATTGGVTPALSMPVTSQYIGETLHVWARLSHASTATIRVAPLVKIGGNASIIGDQRQIALTTSWKWYYVGSLAIPRPAILDSEFYSYNFGVVYYSLSSTVTVKVDYHQYIDGPYIGKIDIANSATRMLIEGEDALTIDATAKTMYSKPSTEGASVDLVPESNNFIFVHHGDKDGADVFNETVIFNNIYITPRWLLI